VRGVRLVDVDQLEVGFTPSLSRAGVAKPPTDSEIRQTIVKSFVYDPRVASVNPEVTVENNVVTLRGRVSTRKAKQAAVQIAQNTVVMPSNSLAAAATPAI
jgi:osmotically-inducible protein OsmY